MPVRMTLLNWSYRLRGLLAGSDPVTSPMLAKDHAAPNFTLADLDGCQHSLRDLLADGPVLLAFFKVSCPTCQYTLPFLERLHQSPHAANLRVMGVSQDGVEATRRFNQTYGVTFPVLLDLAADGYRVSNAYGLTNVPSLFVVEHDGSVSESFMGFSKPDLERVAHRLQIPVFQPGENIPAFRPG